MKVNPYIMTNWKDHIIDIESQEVVQEGTRFTASRANNIEEGIYNCYGELIGFHDEITRLKILIEMAGRVPVNNGTFFDTFEEGNEKALELLKNSAVVQNALNIGATTIKVDNASVFKANEYVTIYDDEQIETLKITNIIGNDLTVTATTKIFKKGAIISKSNIIRKNNKCNFGDWGNYNIEIKEVI